MKNLKIWLYLFSISLLSCILLTGSHAFAHKVNIFAYVEGNKVFTESYFNDGRKCVNSIVRIFDSDGTKLLEGTTNENGEFSFIIPKKGDLKVVLSAGMGHRAEYTIAAHELPGTSPEKGEEIIIQKNPQTTETPQYRAGKQEILKPDTTATKVIYIEGDQLRCMIESTLDKKLSPLIKLLVQLQKPSISITEIIGGIGYIFGIMGILAYVKSRAGANR